MKTAVLCSFLLLQFVTVLVASNNVPANNPYIQYFGRWDMSNPTAPTHSWPGVYIYAEFEGTSIGINTNDNFSYYNVYIDDSLYSVFHGTIGGVSSYSLASGLTDGHHKLLFTLRNETNWTNFSFNGFILDNGKNLLPPLDKPLKKIEFIGDSYTCASGNEWTDANAAPNDSYTNIVKGFGPLVARNYKAQYQMSGRGGFGLVLDYQGNYGNTLPNFFDRTLVYTPLPKWDFSKWIPNLVVICLGLNDYNGWGGYSGPIPQDHATLYRTKYHDFIATVMGEYRGANILAVAANGLDWIKNNVSQVVAEEIVMGHTNVHYAFFPYYNNGYVNNGHPTVATHQKIADTLAYAIDAMNAWQPYHGTVLPRITQAPSSPFTVYDTSYVLNIQTDSYVTLRFSTQDKAYSQMENTFTTTGKRNHSITLSCMHGMQYTYYLRGMDVYGNMMDTSTAVKFSVDTTKTIVPWTFLVYDHAHWKKGKAPLGNATDTSVATHTGTVTTVYYRNTFTLSADGLNSSYILGVVGNDGAVIYINGVEYGRINMPSEKVTYNLLALGSLRYNQSLSLTRLSGLRLLHEGANSIAIEVHTANSSKISTSFDASFQDASAVFYIPPGSTWSYYDDGGAPPDQLVNRTTDIATETSDLIPKETVLYPNYPNPFNPTTNISFSLPSKSFVTLRIFDMIGREVATIASDELPAGKYTRQWNATNFASGIYFYRLQAGSFTETKKLILVK